ncbi:RND family efflux transporter MFP subunit [Litoreibacter meonggei]|uniref:RND family efflux transporter MFP subunit n=1 Tax=Litoreibacter meonggei TaxID=1049199 RepID=A0A497WSG9_9RHOB|nr:efflux RND transporter periplasmic adaptor subunit [Litoreibacter meonggei]RLJ59552.1 RND family efflux transporter MFP subunit [Litoreibacter meonggei]
MLRTLLVVTALCLPFASVAQSVSAILEPVNSVEIRPSVNGRLDKILVQEGAVVTKGTVLASIDARVQRARVALASIAAQADGAVIRAEIVIEQAKALRDRVARARSKGAAQKWEVIQSEQAVQLAEADLKVAREGVSQSQRQLELDEAVLEEFSMIAPFDGTILEIQTQRGEIVETETTVLEIGNLKRLRATAFVPLDWLNGLDVGTEIVAQLPTGATATGVVSSIDPRVDPASLSVRVRMAFDNTDLKLLAGTAITISSP